MLKVNLLLEEDEEDDDEDEELEEDVPLFFPLSLLLVLLLPELEERPLLEVELPLLDGDSDLDLDSLKSLERLLPDLDPQLDSLPSRLPSPLPLLLLLPLSLLLLPLLSSSFSLFPFVSPSISSPSSSSSSSSSLLVKLDTSLKIDNLLLSSAFRGDTGGGGGKGVSGLNLLFGVIARRKGGFLGGGCGGVDSDILVWW